MRNPIVRQQRNSESNRIWSTLPLTMIMTLSGPYAVLAAPPLHAPVTEHADDIVPDVEYHRFFRQLGIDTVPATAGTETADANALGLDSPYRVFFRDLGINEVTPPSQDKNEKLISPPGIESVRTPSVVHENLSRPSAQPREDDVDVGNVWHRLQNGFKLPELESPLVQSYEQWFAEHPSYIKRVFDRGSIYLPYILQQVDMRSMPTEVALLPVIESAFNPFAESHANAVGMWQFISGTASRYDVRMDFWYDGRRDVIDSTKAALDYLQFLESEMQGNWFHAFASYNVGENRLRREIRRNRKKGRSSDFVNLRLPKETRHYVPRLIALRNVIRDPGRFGIELPAIDLTSHFSQLQIDYPIDLGIAAELSGVTLNHLRKLNPGYRRRSTGSDGASRLLLPQPNAARLLQALESRSAKSLLAAAGYRVRKGDTLSQIGRRTNLSVKAIKTANSLNGDFLKVGQVLNLPIHSQSFSALGKDGIAVFGDAKSKSATRAKNRVTHRVRPGDTLTAIARQYKVYVKQIASWNSMRTTDVIRGGQKLVIHRSE